MDGVRRAEQRLFAVLLGLVWVGVVLGFGSEIARDGFDFPLIIHFHALAFVSWLVLLTAQLVLVRTRRLALHQKLGMAGAGLAALMIVLGVGAAVAMARIHYRQDGRPFVLLAVELADMVAFGTLVLAGLVLRSRPESHKRLILLATIYISTPGFVRFLGGFLHAALGSGFWGRLGTLYVPADLLVVALGAGDLLLRRRLYPAYVAGAAWTAALQVGSVFVMLSSWWPPLERSLIGAG